jgi:hypothetical protein
MILNMLRPQHSVLNTLAKFSLTLIIPNTTATDSEIIKQKISYILIHKSKDNWPVLFYKRQHFSTFIMNILLYLGQRFEVSMSPSIQLRCTTCILRIKTYKHPGILNTWEPYKKDGKINQTQVLSLSFSIKWWLHIGSEQSLILKQSKAPSI